MALVRPHLHYEDGPKRSVTGRIPLFTDMLAYRSMHQSNKQCFLYYNDIKHMVEGNNLAELRDQIHAPVIDTVLFSCASCFCLLVIHAAYFNN